MATIQNATHPGHDVPVAHGGEDHEAPPEAVREAPPWGGVLLGKVDEAGEGEDADYQEHHQQPQLLVRLAQRWQQALQAIEVTHKLGIKYFLQQDWVALMSKPIALF